MTMAHKQGVFEEKLQEYLWGDKKRKGEILEAVVLVSGLTRKGAIKRFRRMQRRSPGAGDGRGRPRTYTAECLAALKEVWEMGAEACGENLHPMIGEYIDIQMRENSWKHDEVVTFKLKKMSLGSMKKYLGTFVHTRRNFGGKTTTQKSSFISLVPIRMDGWSTAEAGVTQVDTVAHCGDSIAGDYCFTTNATDVATLWGTRRAQWNKGQVATRVSLVAMRADSPFPWTELHPDSGSEFINNHCIKYAGETNLRMTRSRPYHKNDNCFVEERNGHVVRVYVGFDRLDVPQVVTVLNDLYDVLTPYLNHFVASRRVVSKERIGARWRVVREKVAKTPYQRVLERSDISDVVKNELRAEHVTLNPRTMKIDIDQRAERVYAVQKQRGNPKKL